MLNHNYIGTEHILLGLLREDEGVAAKALTTLGVSLEAVRRDVGEIVGQGSEVPRGHIPFTPRAKKVLELSLREALQLGHNYIGTEHILLGLIREGEGIAAQVLQKLGADLNRVRQTVVQLLSEHTAETATAVGEAVGVFTEGGTDLGTPGRRRAHLSELLRGSRRDARDEGAGDDRRGRRPVGEDRVLQPVRGRAGRSPLSAAIRRLLRAASLAGPRRRRGSAARASRPRTPSPGSR